MVTRQYPASETDVKSSEQDKTRTRFYFLMHTQLPFMQNGELVLVNATRKQVTVGVKQLHSLEV